MALSIIHAPEAVQGMLAAMGDENVEKDGQGQFSGKTWPQKMERKYHVWPQQLRALAALTEDASSVPSAHMGQFTTTYNSSSVDLTLSSGFYRYHHAYVCMCTCTCVHTIAT